MKGERMLEQVMWVEQNCWPEELQASKLKMVSRLAIFPEGFVYNWEGDKVVGVSTSMRFFYNPKNPPRSWEHTTGDGWITNHQVDGDSLYVVSVGVAKDYQGQGRGATLVQGQKTLAVNLGLKYVVLGSRVPSAHLKPDVPIEQVVEEDSEIAFYKKCGLEVVEIVPNYMADDPESLNYGVVMHWATP